MKLLVLVIMTLTVVSVKAKKKSADPMRTTCETIGPGGNGHVHGSACYFPFTFRGKKYNRCTRQSSANGRPWCFTIPHGKKGSPYAECLPKTCKQVPDFAITCETTGRGHNGHHQGDLCFFPFVHNGRRYTSCKKGGKGKPWCYTVPFAKKKGSPWAECVPGTCQRVAEEAITCDTKGRGGAGHHEGDRCFYPYKHKGRKITKCTRAGRSKPFCYTKPFARKGSPWANCLQKTCTRVPAKDFTCDTVNGKKCHFPFKHKGVTYTTCTSEGSNKAWCYTVPHGKRGDPWAACKLSTCRRVEHHDDHDDDYEFE